jgi:hypothetical protein
MLEEQHRRAARIAVKSVDQRVDELAGDLADEPALQIRRNGARVGRIAGALHLDVLHGLDRVLERRAQLADRRERLLRIRLRSAVAHLQRSHARSVARRLHQGRIDVQLVGGCWRVLAPQRQHFACPRDRERDRASDDFALHRMQLELELRDHAEVAAAAPRTPVELRVLLGARVHELAVRRDDVDGLDVVDRHPELAGDAPEAAAERQTTDAGVRDRSEGCHELVRRRCLVDLAEQRTTRSPRAARRWIDPHGAQRGKIDLHALVAGRLAGVAVTAAFHCDQQAVRAREVDRGLDVRHIHGLYDQCRMLIERRIQDVAGIVVAGITSQQQLPVQLGGEILDVLAAQRDLSTLARDGSNVRD